MFFDFFRVQKFLGPKTTKSFQGARPLKGAPGAEDEKNRSVFDENLFFETATEKKFPTCFAIFFRARNFFGPETG